MNDAARHTPTRPRRWSRTAMAAVLGMLLLAAATFVTIQPAERAAGGVIPVAGHGEGVERAAYAAAAAPSGTAATTAEMARGTVTLSAAPARSLPASDADITVHGTGFDPHAALWVAVCQDDGMAPARLTHCLGGPIPDGNSTTSWGVVTADGSSPYPGPNSARWSPDGSFTIALHLRTAAGQDADCLSGPCSVYARSAHGLTEIAQVPVDFAVSPSSSTSNTVPATQTIGAKATTVTPKTIASSSVAAGADQSVIFAGFQPGETVDVTLYSDPVPLPPVTADSDGVVTVSLTVPRDLPAGEHLIQVVGQQSGVTGIAQFIVGAAQPTTTTATAGSGPGSATGVGSAPSAETMTSAMIPSAPSTAPTTSPMTAGGSGAASETDAGGPNAGGAAVLNTAETASTAASDQAPAETETAANNTRLIWLLIAFGVLIVLAGATAVVVLVRHREAH